jgi:hypothetical protein
MGKESLLSSTLYPFTKEEWLSFVRNHLMREIFELFHRNNLQLVREEFIVLLSPIIQESSWPRN